MRAADAYDFERLAYCFMPDHLHLLVEGATPRADLRAFVADAKRAAAHAARPWLRGRLWQPRFFDRVLRDRDDAHAFVKYMIENPMRAGIGQRQAVFPFIGGTRVSTGTWAV